MGRFGRIVIGLGLITLALQLIVAATRPLIDSSTVRQLLAALPNDVLLDILVGAVLTVLSYSSLAVVLLTATLAGAGMLPRRACRAGAGANVGSGCSAILTTARSDIATRRLPVGNLVFKLAGCLLIVPWLPQLRALLEQYCACGAAAGGGLPPAVQRGTGPGLHRPDAGAGAGWKSG